MSAGQIAAPRIRVVQPLVAGAIVAAFAVGLVSGLVLPRALDHLGQDSAATAASVTAADGSSSYQLFRQGERAALTAPSTTNAYQLFRQGERAALGIPSSSNAYQLFRQGERAALSIPSATDTYQLFRQGERAP